MEDEGSKPFVDGGDRGVLDAPLARNVVPALDETRKPVL